LHKGPEPGFEWLRHAPNGASGVREITFAGLQAEGLLETKNLIRPVTSVTTLTSAAALSLSLP